MDEIFPVPQRTGESEDLPKVLATVVNVVNSDIQHSTDIPGLTMPSGQPIIEASLTAFPAYSSLTADTPRLTANSLTSATSTTSSVSTTSATTSRPLISSSASSPAQTSSVPSASSGSSASSALTSSSPSRVSRTGTKPTSSLPSSITSPSSSLSSTTSSITGTTTTDVDPTSTRWIDGLGGGGSGKTGSTGPTSTSTDASPPPTGGPSVPPTTSKIVGGVVGSVAGAVMLVILALFLLKRRTAMRTPHEALPSSETAAAAEGATRGNPPAEMTSRFSRDSMLAASYFAPAFLRRWRGSSHTDSTLVSAGSERGFQKISGRKIPSVLTSGGDGYGGGYETVSPAASEPSMTPGIPGSPVHPRSPSQPPPPSTPYGMPLDVSYTRETAEHDDDTDRPARSAAVPGNIPRTGALSPPMAHQPLQRPNLLRTSHSFDTSRGSRFTEDF